MTCRCFVSRLLFLGHGHKHGRESVATLVYVFKTVSYLESAEWYSACLTVFVAKVRIECRVAWCVANRRE